MAVSMSSARFGQGCEGGDIEPMIALDVELDCLSTDEQEWRTQSPFFCRGVCRLLIVDDLSQLVERLSQAPERLMAGTIGPQQTCQSIPPMRVVGLHTQVGQQRLNLVGGEVNDRLTVQGRSESPEEPHRESSHRRHSTGG
jgi:hypothetical protein